MQILKYQCVLYTRIFFPPLFHNQKFELRIIHECILNTNNYAWKFFALTICLFIYLFFYFYFFQGSLEARLPVSRSVVNFHSTYVNIIIV